MAASIGPNLVTNGLIFYMDPANVTSYPGTGTTYTDLTGSNSGALNGLMTYNVTTNSFDAQGATATSATWISTNAINFLDATAYTMEFAVKLRAGALDTTFQTLCGNGGTNPLVLVSGSATSWQMAFRESGAGDYHYSQSVTNYNLASNWAILTMTVQTNRSIEFYLNGSLIPRVLPLTTPTSTQLTVSRVAGGYSSGVNNYPWQGLTSHVRFYNRALNATEISANFQAMRKRHNV